MFEFSEYIIFDTVNEVDGWMFETVDGWLVGGCVGRQKVMWLCPPILIVVAVFQLEIESGNELTSDYLYDEVHPKQHAYKPAFAKPRGPQGKRGNRRITRPPGEQEEED